MAKKVSHKASNVLDAGLGKFDKKILSELKSILSAPIGKAALKEQVEEMLDIELTDAKWKQLYKLFYSELQKTIIQRADIVKELLKYRVSKTPKVSEAIHFYIHPDIVGDYKTEDFIDSQSGVQQSNGTTVTNTSEIPPVESEV